MKLNTDQFGEIEIEANRIVTFTAGIPGFEHLQQFIFLQPELEIPFSFMQSIEDPNISLIVTNPFHFYPDYVCELPYLYINELMISQEQDAMIWSVVTIQGSLDKATINLLAPIIVNSNQKLGKQIILHGTEYQTKHVLFNDRPELVDSAQEQG
jgi:flagellar assembly factor FliW